MLQPAEPGSVSLDEDYGLYLERKEGDGFWLSDTKKLQDYDLTSGILVLRPKLIPLKVPLPRTGRCRVLGLELMRRR
jgi:hypothetical protein